MYLIIVPSRAMPITSKMTAITVQMARFSNRISANAVEMTMNAPVGPPIQTLVPPSDEMSKPAMTAVKIHRPAAAPERWQGHRQGQDRDARSQSRDEVSGKIRPEYC
jgi:hypothetical protein